MLKHGVPQGSVLGPILFLIYIIDLNHAKKYCKVQPFADDTNLLHFNSSTKNLNRLAMKQTSWHEASICLAEYQQNFSKCTADWISDL